MKKGHSGQIRKALQLLLAAKRPYIYTGGGVLLGNACAELRELVDMLGYPVTVGTQRESDPRSTSTWCRAPPPRLAPH